MKKKFLTLFVAIFSLLSIFFITQAASNSNTAQAATSGDPIFFVPGAYLKITDWDRMYQELDPSDVHPIVKLYVQPDGTVLRQDIRTTNNGERPFVTVYFQNTSYDENAVYQGANGLNHAIRVYDSATPFQKADILAQSNGGNIVTHYLEEYPNNLINSFISLGTPYNYKANNGDPATDLLLNSIAYSSRLNPNLNLITVIGRTPSSLETDSVVSRDGASSGRNIYYWHVASFRQLYLTGSDAINGNQTWCPEMAQIISSNLDLL